MAERNLKPVLETNSKELVFVRPSKLAKEGTTGVVAEGIYTGKVENKFDENKYDYRVEGEERDYILNSAGSLDRQMEMVSEGQYVQIHYNGKPEITSGKNQGKAFHNFQVLAEQD